LPIGQWISPDCPCTASSTFPTPARSRGSITTIGPGKIEAFPDEQAALCRQWAETGYVIQPKLIPESLLDAVCRNEPIFLNLTE
jgi:hypothetical protein